MFRYDIMLKAGKTQWLAMDIIKNTVEIEASSRAVRS
jgi:hypothetical protein